MSKGCVEPDSSDGSLGRIIYAVTWGLVHIGLVRMIANAPTHPPAPGIRSKESASTQPTLTGSVSTESISTESTPLGPVSMEFAPAESTSTKSAPTELMQSGTCQSTATAIRSSSEPTSTLEADIPLRPQRVIVRPDNFFKMAGVNADPNAAFTKTEQKILESFMENLRNQRLELSSRLGFPLPTCHASLVSVTSRRTFVQVVTGGSDETGRTKTYIRITGLMNRRQTSSFHNVLTMEKYRGLYEPLDLCYEKDQVSRMALDASCAIRDPAQTLTLCGCTIIIQTPGQDQRTSTIGGLLTVRGKFYALTTSHMPDDDDGFPEDTVDFESDDDRGSLFFFDKNDDLEDESSSSVTPFEFDDGTGEKGKTVVQLPKTASLDVDISKKEATSTEERVPGLSPEEKESRTSRVESSSKKSGVAATPHIITKSSSQTKGFLDLIEGDDLKSGDDWLLVPIGTNLLFPNRLPAGVEKPATWQNPFIDSFCLDLGKLRVDENDPNKPPSQRTVWAIAGMGGLIRSSLCPNPSFILSNGCERISKVWMVEAEAPSQGFQAGDSGSWIVDDRSRRVLGVLVARIGGVGYMTSFASVRQDIATALQIRQTSVRLASRVNPLLRGRGGSTGRVLRSFSPVSYERRAPAARSWSQMLSDAAAATLDVVRHPVDLGQHPSLPIFLSTLVHMSFLYEIPWAWSSVTTLQNALLPPLGALLLWGYTEVKMQWRPTVYSRHDRLVIRRTRCTWLWVALAAGLSASLVIYIVRGPAPTPFTLRSNGQRVNDESLRGFSEAVQRLSRSDPQARYNEFEKVLRGLYEDLRDLEFQAAYSRIRDMVSRKFSRHKWQNRL